MHANCDLFLFYFVLHIQRYQRAIDEEDCACSFPTGKNINYVLYIINLYIFFDVQYYLRPAK